MHLVIFYRHSAPLELLNLVSTFFYKHFAPLEL